MVEYIFTEFRKEVNKKQFSIKYVQYTVDIKMRI